MALLAAVFGLVTLLSCCGQLEANGYRACFWPCPPGQRCQLRRAYGYDGYIPGYRPVCITEPTPVPGPPSCQDIRCGDAEICVLQQVVCVTTPCYPLPTCIPNRCAAVRCSTGNVCVTSIIPDSDPACAPFPNCRYQVSCVPRAKPKPGFCPAPEQVSQANVNLCEYDNDCPSNLLCCPGASRGGLNCTAPAFPNPCHGCMCPPHEHSVGATCAVRDGDPTCLDRVCEPGSFFCRDGRQFFCSDEAEIVETDLPAPLDC